MMKKIVKGFIVDYMSIIAYHVYVSGNPDDFIEFHESPSMMMAMTAANLFNIGKTKFGVGN